MKMEMIWLFRPIPRAAVAGLAALLACAAFPKSASAQAVPQITSASVANGMVRLNWTGSSFSYQVQNAASLAPDNWSPVLFTARTNATLAVRGNSAFYRVVGLETNETSLVVTVTNLASGESVTTTLLPQTNADLSFFGPTNWFGSNQVVFPATEQQRVDVAFDPSGGFQFVDPSGGPLQDGGWVSAYPGPGTNQSTYVGVLTNPYNAVVFSAVATSPAQPQAKLKDLGGLLWNWSSQVSLAAGWAIDWNSCTNLLVGKALQCAAACTTQSIACHLNIFNIQNAYCLAAEQLSWATNAWGFGVLTVCDLKCDTGCCYHGDTRPGCQ